MYAIKWKKDVLPLSVAGDEYPGRWVFDAEVCGIDSEVVYALIDGGTLQLSRREGSGRCPFWKGKNKGNGISGVYAQDSQNSAYNQSGTEHFVHVTECESSSAVSLALEDRLRIVKPICESCSHFKEMTSRYMVSCTGKTCQSCSGVPVNHICPQGKWDKALSDAGILKHHQIRPTTSPHVILSLLDKPTGTWPNGFHKWQNVQLAHRLALEQEIDRLPDYRGGNGSGIVVVGGGRYFPSAYVSISIIRRFNRTIPIELWILPEEKLNGWQRASLEGMGVDVRVSGEMRCVGGWELKLHAIRKSKLKNLVFFDADCYPTRNPAEFLEWKEFKETGLVLWPDRPMKYSGDNSAGSPLDPKLIGILGFPYKHEWAKEAGQMVIDRKRHWKSICLADWMNQHSDYYYKHLYGDKDTICLSCLKLNEPYSVIPRQWHGEVPALLGFDFDGKVTTVHRCNGKLSLGNHDFPMTQQYGNDFNPAIPLEVEAHGYIRHLGDIRKKHGIKIHAITVCVNYSDYLSRIIEKNRHHFHAWTIVTSPEDLETRSLCLKNGLKCVLSSNANLNQASFNFGALRNAGIDWVSDIGHDGEDWILLLDADVILPPDLHDKLEESNLDPECIYGITRQGDSGIEYRDQPLSGFFQLFRRGIKYRYSEGFPSAGECDIHFASQWSKHKRVLLPIKARHLGTPAEDWFGRVTPRIPDSPERKRLGRVVVSRDDGGFGDTLLSAMAVQILRDNDIDAVWWSERPEFRELIDVPMWDKSPLDAKWRFEYESSQFRATPFVKRAIDNFAKAHGITTPLRITQNRVPLKYVDDPTVFGADVALCLKGGEWSRYRWYPYADQLKSALSASGITWVDVNVLRGQKMFNAVHKSSIYVGIDTGTTHAAASLNSSGIILQSGYNSPSDWNHDYPYEILSVPVPCAPCGLKEGCQYDHRCMKELSVARVVSAIKENLSKTTRKAA